MATGLDGGASPGDVVDPMSEQPKNEQWTGSGLEGPFSFSPGETPQGELLKAAVSDRDRHPWRYYKLDHETMKRLLDEMAQGSQDAAAEIADWKKTVTNLSASALELINRAEAAEAERDNLTKGQATLIRALDTASEELVTLRAELEGTRFAVDDWVARVAALEDETRQREAALSTLSSGVQQIVEFAQHKEGCKSLNNGKRWEPHYKRGSWRPTGWYGAWVPDQTAKYDCTCGLEAALSGLDAALSRLCAVREGQ